MVSSGIVIRSDSEIVRSRAQRLGLAVEVSATWLLPWERTLFLADVDAAPWDLIRVGFDFLDKWDAAVPTWELAAELGAGAERERTEKIALDLRQPTYEPRLLFVRDNAAGQELLSAWRAECGQGDEEHLAFLRAVHLVKPRLCVLPASWLAKMKHRQPPASRQVAPQKASPLVTVELETGRYVKCHRGDEARVRAQFARQRQARRR